jgi:hypothetical protein
MNKIGLSFLWICLGLGLTIGSSVLIDNPAAAQRKNVSAKEVNGTFKTADGSNIIKVLSVGRGGLDRPGYNLQVEMYVSLRQGPNGEVRGNTGTLKGYAGIVGDLATFTPDGMDSDKCSIAMKFTKPGTLVVKQKGTCDFNADIMTTAGTYKKTNSKEPVFEQ